MITDLEDKIGFTENINRALRVLRFILLTGLKVSPFELHHGKKPKTELTNIVKDIKSHLSDWKTINVSVPPKQIPIYQTRNGKKSVTNHIVMATKKKRSMLFFPQITKKSLKAG